jgi:hypothetical protein
MLKSTRAREIVRDAGSGHKLMLAVLMGATALLAVSPAAWPDGFRHHEDHHNKNRRVALWVANGGGPNVPEFSSRQLFQSIVSSAPHRLNSSGVFVNPQDTLFDRAGNLWVVDGGNPTAGTGEAVFEFSREQINQLKETPDPTPVFAITNSGGVPGFVFPQFAVFDKAGDLFVEDTGGNLIDVFSAQQLAIASGTGLKPACVFASSAFNGPLGAIFDKDNNLFVAQNGDTSIVRINAADLLLTNPACSTGQVTLTPEVVLTTNTSTPPSINGPWGLAFAKNGNLWVSNEQNVAPNNSGTGTIVVFAATDITSSHTPTPLVTISTTTEDALDTIDDPQGISFNKFGDLAVANDADSTIAVFGPRQLKTGGSLVPRVFIAGTNTLLNAPTGLIFGPDVR